MAPVHGRLQGPLPGQSRSSAVGEQGETVVEAGGDLLHGEHLHLCRCKLYRQGYAVQPVAYLRHVHRVSLREREFGLDGLRPVHEQVGRFEVRHVLDGRKAAGIRQGERGHGQAGFANDPERLPTGGEDAQVRARPEQCLGKHGAGLHEMLAVVENEEHLLGSEVV